MNWPEAEKLVAKVYCPEPGCERKRPIIKMSADGYTVVGCNQPGHTMAVAKSLFRQLLERWRQGEQLFSLEGLIFTHALMSMARKDTDRWDYQEDDKGRVIRIGKEWWPGYTPTEKEKEMTTQALVEYTPTQLSQIRNELAVGKLTDQEFNLFLAVCRRTGLDPFARQIYAIKYEGKNPRMSIITGIDGYRLMAARTGEYAGSDAPEFSTTFVKGKDGNSYPEWAKVTVYRMVQGQRVGFMGIARWTEFAKDVTLLLGEMWKKMPHNQLAKCAEGQALRKGFPLETMELTFSAEPVPIGHDPNVNAQTGEIIDGSYQVLPAPTETQGHQYLTVCPFHGLRFEEKKGQNTSVFWSHGVPAPDAYTDGKKWCNRNTALRILIQQSREALGWSAEDIDEVCKEHYQKPPSSLSDEQRCEVIEYLRNTLAAQKQELEVAIEAAETEEAIQESLL